MMTARRLATPLLLLVTAIGGSLALAEGGAIVAEGRARPRKRKLEKAVMERAKSLRVGERRFQQSVYALRSQHPRPDEAVGIE